MSLPETIEAPAQKKIIRCFTWRGSHNEYRMKFQERINLLMIDELISVTQSESDGNISVTVFYR